MIRSDAEPDETVREALFLVHVHFRVDECSIIITTTTTTTTTTTITLHVEQLVRRVHAGWTRADDGERILFIFIRRRGGKLPSKSRCRRLVFRSSALLLAVVVVVVVVVSATTMTTETSHPSPMKCHIIIDKTLSDNSSSPPNSS